MLTINWQCKIAKNLQFVRKTNNKKIPPYLKSIVKPSIVKQDMPVYDLKRNNGLKMELTVLSSLYRDNLIAIVTSGRNETFNQTVWNFLASIKEEIHLIDLCLHLKEVILPEIILSSVYDFVIPISFCL